METKMLLKIILQRLHETIAFDTGVPTFKGAIRIKQYFTTDV